MDRISALNLNILVRCVGEFKPVLETTETNNLHKGKLKKPCVVNKTEGHLN